MSLPLRYMRVLFDLTGYWGTYMPTRLFAPGMIGRRANGMFEQITHLDRFAAYDAKLLGLQSYAREESICEWSSQGVVTRAFTPSISAPGKVAEVNVDVQFRRSGDALLVLQDVRHHQFTDTRNLKHLLHDLREAGEWEADYCVITEVIEASSAWVFFATGDDQSASLSAKTSVVPAAVPDSLRALVGNAEIAASLGCKQFQGFYINLPSGGTPLFSALCFRREWWQLGLGRPDTVQLKGADQVFEEPMFGDTPEDTSSR